jgi:adenylate cyclase class IV
MSNQSSIVPNTEVEFKYWAADYHKAPLTKALAEHSPLTSPLYVVSCDDYYVTDESVTLGEFVRFRKSNSVYELTIKRKENTNTKSNVIRTEVNVNVTGNDDESVRVFLSLQGYRKAFSVFKEAWIWQTDDCDVSFYTLADGRSVVELEATRYSTVEEGVEVINAWEARLGLGSLRKEVRSLYEIFSEEREG